MSARCQGLTACVIESGVDDIHGLKPFMLFAPNWRLLLLLGVVVLAFGALATWWARRPRKPARVVDRPAGPPTSPLVSARQRLEELRARGLIEGGKTREFHAALSALMRGYLGVRFGLPGRRMTTTELLTTLASVAPVSSDPAKPALNEAHYRMLGDFLPRCDVVKFAGLSATVAEMNEVWAVAVQLVEALGDINVSADELDEAVERATAPLVGRAS